MKPEAVIPVVLLLLLCSCSSQNLSSGRAEEVFLIYNIKVGESGGFTNNNQGYIIDSTGLVSSFQAIAIKAPVLKALGNLTPDDIKELNLSINEIKDQKYSEKGNITSYISLTKGSEELRVSWPGHEPNGSVPEQIRKFYSKLRHKINSIQNK